MKLSKILRNGFIVLLASLVLTACATKSVKNQTQGDVYTGKERPVDSGSTPLSWSKNRRSVTVKAN